MAAAVVVGLHACQIPTGVDGADAGADAGPSHPELPPRVPLSDDDAWPPDEPLPEAFDLPPWATMPAPGRIVIGWRTAWETGGAVRVRAVSPPGASHAVPSPAFGHLHRVDLGALEPATTYAYEVLVTGTGATRVGAFTTPGRARWRFIHMAEAHVPSQSAHVGAFAGVIREFRPHVVVESGDMVDGGTTFDVWRRYLRTSAPWISNVILLPAHSNHANGFQGNPHLLALFALPDNGRWYTTRYGQVEFFTLDSTFDGFANPDVPSQGAFIRERAGAARDGDDDPAFVVGAWHYPACSSRYAGRAGQRAWVRDNFLAAFADAGGLDLALVGHDKYYERSVVSAIAGPWEPMATVHVMTNAGMLAPSAPSQIELACEPIVTDTATRSLGLFSVADGELTGIAVDQDGRVLDRFSVAPRAPRGAPRPDYVLP